MTCAPTATSLSKRHHGNGFTLLEVLVAMSIFALVMALIFGTFEGVFSNADHVNAASDVFEMADSCLKRISSDLSEIYVLQVPRYKPPEMGDEPDLYRIKGENENMGGSTFAKLRFTSLAHLPINGDNREGIAEIVYYVEEIENNQYIIRRKDTLYPYPEDFEASNKDPLLCEQVREFKLIFYNKDGDEQEDWDSDEDDYEYCTPSAIGIVLKLGDEEAPYEFQTAVKLPMQRIVKSKI